MRAHVPLLAGLALALAVAVYAGLSPRATGPAETRLDADAGVRPDDAVRVRTITVAPGVPGDVATWVQSALSRVRPEARRLIDAVDGQVTVDVHPADRPVAGFVRPTETGFVLSLNDGLRQFDDEIRDHVVVHELGHVVDLALVPPALNAELDAGVPRIGTCPADGGDAACAPAEERFADTFAKWALDDPVVLSGIMSVGYRVAPPANLHLWGEPLTRLPS